MIKKAILILFSWYAISLFWGCCTSEYETMWTDFNTCMVDNSGIEPAVSDAMRFDKRAFALRVWMQDSVRLFTQHLTAFKGCMATSCGEKYVHLNKLESVSVKTINNYSEHFLSGSYITSLFKARKVDEGYSRTRYLSLENAIEQLNEASNYAGALDLYLMDTTCVGGQQQFEIAITLSNGKVIVKQTSLVELY